MAVFVYVEPNARGFHHIFYAADDAFEEHATEIGWLYLLINLQLSALLVVTMDAHVVEAKAYSKAPPCNPGDEELGLVMNGEEDDAVARP